MTAAKKKPAKKQAAKPKPKAKEEQPANATDGFMPAILCAHTKLVPIESLKRHPRNSLFAEYARLLAELQPKVFVMENVTGMVKGHMKQAYLKIMATLRGCGYTAKGEVMNAMYYGVPQSRQRVIIIGVRNDLEIEPTHPKPQTIPKACGKALCRPCHCAAHGKEYHGK